jgi:large subunit ribosomal protein L24
MGLGIKKQDTAIVITGKEKGKKGRVLAVMPQKGKVLLEKVNIIKRHMKPSRKYTQGGIIEKEAPLRISNVMLICPKCGAKTKIGALLMDEGSKARVCRKCKEVMD